MLTLKSRSTVTIVGTVVNEFQNGTKRYQLAFTGSYVPRYGESHGLMAGVCDCDSEVYDIISKRNLPFSCAGVVIYNDNKKIFELADADLAEVKK